MVQGSRLWCEADIAKLETEAAGPDQTHSLEYRHLSTALSNENSFVIKFSQITLTA
jgi:hypothetical protein